MNPFAFRIRLDRAQISTRLLLSTFHPPTLQSKYSCVLQRLVKSPRWRLRGDSRSFAELSASSGCLSNKAVHMHVGILCRCHHCLFLRTLR